MSANAKIAAITARIVERSKPTRETYLGRICGGRLARASPQRALAAAISPMALPSVPPRTRPRLQATTVPNLGIITSYNDMLSAHQPFETYPAMIREAAREAGGVAQVAGGVPAMCDGVTQGQPGMELSLFSRDLIAMAAGVGLSHNMFDCGRLSRRLRQDRAGPCDRGPDLRPSAGRLHSRRPDDHPACRMTRSPASASFMPKARSAATNCWKPNPSPITAPAPAPSTARPIPTRC